MVSKQSSPLVSLSTNVRSLSLVNLKSMNVSKKQRVRIGCVPDINSRWTLPNTCRTYVQMCPINIFFKKFSELDTLWTLGGSIALTHMRCIQNLKKHTWDLIIH